jgi:hypothetical protein
MTIERPMFPPRAESPEPAQSTSEVIKFRGCTKRTPRKRKSAIADVKKSGYELVPSRRVPKDKSKRLTDSELGKAPFEPREKCDDDMAPINGENWHARRVDVRFAHAVMTMSKEGLIDLHATVDMDHVDAWVARLRGTIYSLCAGERCRRSSIARLPPRPRRVR